MTWDAVGAIAESISAVIVLITVIYLAIQINQLKIQTRITSSQHAFNASNEIALGILNSPDTADLIVRAFEGYGELSRADRLRYRQWVRIQASQLESIVVNMRLNGVAIDEYVAVALPDLLALPGFADYWRRDGHLYGKSFRDLVDQQLEVKTQ